jgi:D-alanine-D-alanine ligase
MKKINIAVLMGGRTAEHDISLKSGTMVVNHLDRRRYNVKPVVISRGGRWYVPRGYLGPREWSPVHGRSSGQRFLPVGEALGRLLGDRVDCVFIAMHGPYGEDGTVQGMMEMLDLPYTGSDVCASSLAMDKVKAKEIYRCNRIPTPPALVLDAAEWGKNRKSHLGRIREAIGYPCFLKPVRLGSSVGLTICRDQAELLRKMPSSLRYGGRVLVEAYVEGRELTCAVLDTPGGKPAIALPPTEIIPQTRTWFDYHAKYTPGASREITPAPIGKALANRVQDIALRAHRALGCSGMSRTDMIVRRGRLHVLETNTIPGMTDVSLLPQAASAAGLSFPKLLDRIIATGMEAHRRRRRYNRVGRGTTA